MPIIPCPDCKTTKNLMYNSCYCADCYYRKLDAIKKEKQSAKS